MKQIMEMNIGAMLNLCFPSCQESFWIEVWMQRMIINTCLDGESINLDSVCWEMLLNLLTYWWWLPMVFRFIIHPWLLWTQLSLHSREYLLFAVYFIWYSNLSGDILENNFFLKLAFKIVCLVCMVFDWRGYKSSGVHIHMSIN